MKAHMYRVRGKGKFPIDMLRYDSCWPRTPEDVWFIDMNAEDPDYRKSRDVCLSSNHAPTIARWNSFGWEVIS